MTSKSVCLDTSYLVGLFDESDLWHSEATEMRALLRQNGVEASYFDCVINELFTVLSRRCRQRNRAETFSILADQVVQAIPDTAITWTYHRLPGWYGRCLEIIRTTQGSLNFHDALITIAMRAHDLTALVSFDVGFDQVPSITRLSSTTGVATWIREHRR